MYWETSGRASKKISASAASRPFKSYTTANSQHLQIEDTYCIANLCDLKGLLQLLASTSLAANWRIWTSFCGNGEFYWAEVLQSYSSDLGCISLRQEYWPKQVQHSWEFQSNLPHCNPIIHQGTYHQILPWTPCPELRLCLSCLQQYASQSLHSSCRRSLCHLVFEIWHLLCLLSEEWRYGLLQSVALPNRPQWTVSLLLGTRKQSAGWHGT